MAIATSNDPAAFSAFELAGWDANIAGYDTAFGAVARQTVAPMLDAARVAEGQRVLDVCCGQGVLAAGAARRGARVIGVDFSAAALGLARARVPGLETRQADAQNLPFADASFDAVLCGYGLMHIPDPGRALSEMRRVLRPGGRLSAGVWDEAGVGFKLVYMAVSAHGRMDVALPHGPDFFQFGTEARMSGALEHAGFAAVDTRIVPQFWRVANADAYVAAILGGAVRSRAVLLAQTDAARAAVRDYIADYLKKFADPTGGHAVPMPAIVGAGMRGD